MAKKAATKRKSSPKMLAPACKANERHTNTQIYKTSGRNRYCKCNDCGHTWTETGPFADELRQFAMTLSESLATSPRQTVDGYPVVVISDTDAKDIEQQLYNLATS